MNFFTSLVLEWWQVAVIKLALVSLGILVGAHESVFFLRCRVVVAMVFVVTAGDTASVWWDQATVEWNLDGIACTQDARQCPDGTYVGRTGPRCEFSPCPGGGGTDL
mgnify:CR=1 FL=1